MKENPLKTKPPSPFLHLGCGNKNLKGYTNIDILPSSACDMVADISNLPFANDSCERIYSCANIEHFSRATWKHVLKHWYNLLKPGGLLRLSTADFAAACEEYLTNRNISQLLGLIVGGQKDKYDFHGMVFDFALLERALSEIGFKNIHRYKWQETDIAREGVDDFSQAYLPHMDKKNGRLMMLNIEATK